MPEVCAIEDCPKVTDDGKDNCKGEGCKDLDDFHQSGSVQSTDGRCHISGAAYLYRERDRIDFPDSLFELVFDLIDLTSTTNGTIATIGIGQDAQTGSRDISLRVEDGRIRLCDGGSADTCTPSVPAPIGKRVHIYGTVNGDEARPPRFGVAVLSDDTCHELLALQLEWPLPRGSKVVGAVGCVEATSCQMVVDNLLVMMRVDPPAQ